MLVFLQLPTPTVNFKGTYSSCAYLEVTPLQSGGLFPLGSLLRRAGAMASGTGADPSLLSAVLGYPEEARNPSALTPKVHAWAFCELH